MEDLPFRVHLVGALIGQFLALFSSLVAVIFLWQQKNLKEKHFEEVSQKIPSLELLSRALFCCLWVGFFFLTLACVTGMIFLDFSPMVSDRTQGLKILWAISVWFWYLITLVLRFIMNWPTKRIAQMSLIGFLLLAASFFGFSFVLSQ